MLGKSQEETLAVNSSYPVHILIKGQRLKFQCFGNSVFGTVLMRIGEIMSNPLCLVFISHMLMANSSPELHQILVFDFCIQGFAILNKKNIDCLLLAQFIRDKSSFLFIHILKMVMNSMFYLPIGSMYAIYGNIYHQPSHVLLPRCRLQRFQAFQKALELQENACGSGLLGIILVHIELTYSCWMFKKCQLAHISS